MKEENALENVLETAMSAHTTTDRHAEPAAEVEEEVEVVITEEEIESTGIGTVVVTRRLVLVAVQLDTAQQLCLTLAVLTNAQVHTVSAKLAYSTQ
jgi:hypothetical protein